MSNPMASYDDSALDFLNTYRRKISSDPRLEFHQDVVRDFGESYERAYQLINTYMAEAYKDVSYYLGNQWSLEELAYLNNQRRSSFTYNYTKRVIDLLVGQQINNRHSITAFPVEDASDQTATDLSDVIQHIMNCEDGYPLITRGYKGALTSGLSWLSVYQDYRDDPVNGDVRIGLDDWNAVMFDPFMTKRDLSDCGFVARRKFLSRTEVMSLLPDKADIIEGLPWGSRDDKFTYMPFARQWGMQKLLNYTEYWRPKWEMRKVLVDMETGETRPWKGSESRLKAYRELFPQLEIVTKPVRTVELGIIVEGKLLYYGKDPWGLDDYPFVPFMAVWEPSYDLWTWKLQSVVRVMRDPQTELNKRRSKMVDMLDSQLNTGWIAKTGAVTNNASLFKSGNGQVIFLKPEAQMTDIQQIPRPGIDPSIFQLASEFEKDIMQLPGLNPEAFGLAESDKVETAAILSRMRQQAALISVNYLTDGLKESTKLLGRKIMKLIQINYSKAKVKAIIGRDPSPEFNSRTYAKYDIVVEEGLLTDTQKQTEFAQYTALKAMGVQIPDHLIVQESNLHGRKKLGDYMEKQAQEAAAMQKQQMELQMQQLQTQTNAMNSKAESDRALAQERLAKIGLDAALNAERITRAEEERTQGALNLVKAAKEIEDMDANTLLTKVQIVKEIEGKNTPESQ